VGQSEPGAAFLQADRETFGGGTEMWYSAGPRIVHVPCRVVVMPAAVVIMDGKSSDADAHVSAENQEHGAAEEPATLFPPLLAKAKGKLLWSSAAAPTHLD